jgi:4-amino-4-deoxy-L-arabinose transferase-like glycosyltransferase
MIFFISLQPWNPESVRNEVIIGDALEYHPLAESILESKSFDNFSSLRTPGYPLFVALIYSLSSSSVWVVLLVQILLSLVSLYLVYKITLLVTTPKIALLAAFLFSIDTTQAVWTVELYTETLFLLLFLASIYFLCKNVQEWNISHIIVSAILLGAATLIRPISSLFIVVALLIILIGPETKFSRRIFDGILYVLLFLLVLSPWLIHNYSKYGEAKLSSISGFNLLFYNVAFTEVSKSGRTIYEVRKELMEEAARKGADTLSLHSFSSSDIYTGLAKDYIQENFSQYVKRHLMGAVNIFVGLGSQKVAEKLHIKLGARNPEPFGGPGIFKRAIGFIQGKSPLGLIIIFLLGMSLLVNYAFALYGAFSFDKDKILILILFILIIIYFAALTGVVGYDRYRIPFMPFINILCSIGLIKAGERLKGRFKFSSGK